MSLRKTPKNSWELFTWIFFEPILLEEYAETISEKKALLITLKNYIWVVVITVPVWFIFHFFLAYFDIPNLYPAYFKADFIEEWKLLSDFPVKYLYLLENTLICVVSLRC